MLETSDIQAAAQHYVVCEDDGCEMNAQFYCNICYRALCEQCRDIHKKFEATRQHDIVGYRFRKRQLPENKCKHHSKENVNRFCKECKIPLCILCFTIGEHKGHTMCNLSDIYAERCHMYVSQIYDIREYFMPSSIDLLEEVEMDALRIKKAMDKTRKCMIAEAEHVKRMVDNATSEKIKHTYEIEKARLQSLDDQEKIYIQYINYLNHKIKMFYKRLALTDLGVFFSEKGTQIDIQSIPVTNEEKPPVIYAKQLEIGDVQKLLSSISEPLENRERKIRRKKPNLIQLKPKVEQTEQRIEPFVVNGKLKFSSNVKKVDELKVPDVVRACHISMGNLRQIWVSNINGDLVQTDLFGHKLWHIKTSSTDGGYHAVSLSGDLLFADKEKNSIRRKAANENIITDFIRTNDWRPLSVHISRLNEDIQVGMLKEGRGAKVTIYDRIGAKKHSIHGKLKGELFFVHPHYITENNNGDICISDSNLKAVVVMTESGKHRFTYAGHGSGFRPYGICTDVLGHIIVCDDSNKTLNLLDQFNKFQTVLVERNQLTRCPRSVCLDKKNNLYIGQFMTDIVSVYKYLVNER